MKPHAPASTATPTAIATLTAAIATPPAPTIPAVPDVRNLPEKKRHWGTNPPTGFPALDDGSWSLNKDYYPPSKNAAAATENQFRAFLTWYESLARPGSGGVYRHQDSDGHYVITTRSLISHYGTQVLLNLIALAQLDLQARCQDVEYEQRMGWYWAGIHVGMREDELNQSLHNLATTFGLKRQELRLKAAATGNEAFIGPLKYYRSDGFLNVGSYECLVEIPDTNEIRALHFPQDAPLITIFEHRASLGVALAEGIPRLPPPAAVTCATSSNGAIVARINETFPPRVSHDVLAGGQGIDALQAVDVDSRKVVSKNRDLIMEKLKSVHVPLRTLIADGCRLKLATRKGDKEITRLEEISRMNQGMEENAGDMRETGMAASLAAHLGHFVEDLCPLIEQCLSIPPPSTDGASLSISDLPDNPIAPFDYLVSDAGLAQLELKEVPHPEDSCFEIDYNGVRARVEILDSSSTVLLTLLDHDEECTMDFAELPSLMGKPLKSKNSGYPPKGLQNGARSIESIQQYHELLTIATSPLLSEDLELDRVTGAILYMELIWEEICSMVMGERPFACKKERCTSRFKTQHELTRHSGTHSGERRIVCPKAGCWASYKTKADLAKHQKNKHSAPDPSERPSKRRRTD
ncbi:unnamed protein product [Rhizoctonia solani]|uniref:C2H2-type domain-containing protein n=1 Tax=Rhizoctonia solani TaxID=456999 RepID=A0A8H2XXF6_9AGAM|nr:unnamed protein product [Rhizoctonia solani]